MGSCLQPNDVEHLEVTLDQNVHFFKVFILRGELIQALENVGPGAC